MTTDGSPRGMTLAAALLATAAIGWLDFATGVEVRIYPLYFAPISLVAWQAGRLFTVLIALLCTASWSVANPMTSFSSTGVWAWNTFAHSLAFLFVGYVMASLQRTLERERMLSRTDALTLLPNSRAFYEEAERVLARSKRHHRPLSIAYIDVDDFKKVNDTHGHAAGDELLRVIGDVLRSTLRTGDLAARLGGDEFAVLLEETDPDGGKAFLHRARIALTSALNTKSHQVTTSVGAVTFVNAPDDVNQLVSKADAVMYAAKQAGKNRFHTEVV